MKKESEEKQGEKRGGAEQMSKPYVHCGESQLWILVRVHGIIMRLCMFYLYKYDSKL